MDDLTQVLRDVDSNRVRKDRNYLLCTLDLVALFAHELEDDQAADGLRDLIRGVRWRLEGDRRQL